MDFYKIRTKENKTDKTLNAYPDWVVGQVKDLMVRGGTFYAVWDDAKGMWSTNEFDVQRLVDADIRRYVEDLEAKSMKEIVPLYTRDFGSGSWERFNRYVRNLPVSGTYHPLDETFTFANTKVKKEDYVSKRLPYSLEEGKTDAWDELLGALYAPDERDKIEWAIGAIVAGDSKWIQKFLVFYGPPASGKSTVIGIIEKLFEGYTATFEAKALVGNGSFGMDAFEHNPLVAIQHDGDLSKIEDNSKLNSIVGHDAMSINIKYKSSFTIRSNAFLIMGTNKPVKITDAKAGSTRRLIDVHPTGAKIEVSRYHMLMENVNFELGAIASKCLKKYHEMGKFYYDRYIPIKMMMLTDHFYNFVETHFDIFKAEKDVNLQRVWELYKVYCEEANIKHRLQRHEVANEISNYFEEFKDRHQVNGKDTRSVYVGFKGLPEKSAAFIPDTSYVIHVDSEYDSAFDRIYQDQPAQEANDFGDPPKKWANVETTLADIDTCKLHFVKIPEQHIVLDFDLVNDKGDKDLELNLEAASKYPATYTELSRSGLGVHLHYIYQGDVTELASVISDGVEIKTLLGNASLRRKLDKCNNLDISTISSGLPKKVSKPVLEKQVMKSEKSVRELVERNLRKEFHPGTKPSIDFIKKILDDAYEQGIDYDLTDMKPVIFTFAAKSTNQAQAAMKVVQEMKFASESHILGNDGDDEKPIVFYDVEVYPNLLIICWMAENSDTVIRMINPAPHEIEPLFDMKLVGFNNRRYDNHIIYARYLGHSIEDIYHLSQRMISNDKSNNSALFGKAYGISYADIYDFTTKKQGLKKYQIELGLHHKEMDIPWDEPVPEERWEEVADYCANDVVTTKQVFIARKADFVARQILAELSGLTTNHTTQQHTAKIIFGDDKNPQKVFNIPDLSEEFPGYKFDGKESTYRGENPSEGGYVYSEPGFYRDVAVLDVASMHPTSIEQLHLFGPYTSRFTDLKAARLAIKRKDYESARTMLDSRLAKFLEGAEEDPAAALALSDALKIVINSVYGLTSARFDNAFKDIRNVDNVVAKRGALFMIDLKHAVQEQGFQVVHIKTDSIKIPGATPDIIDFVTKFGEKYGYDFEHETTYDAFCLVNDAVYIAREDGYDGPKWTAVGAQFQHPYVFKTLFSNEELAFDDFCETKNVTKGALYLEKGDTLVHVGRTGSFMPVKYDGGTLWRIAPDPNTGEDIKHHVGGTKGYQWIERDVAMHREQLDNDLHTDMDYFEALEKKAIEAIEEFVPYREFIA